MSKSSCDTLENKAPEIKRPIRCRSIVYDLYSNTEVKKKKKLNFFGVKETKFTPYKKSFESHHSSKIWVLAIKVKMINISPREPKTQKLTLIIRVINNVYFMLRLALLSSINCICCICMLSTNHITFTAASVLSGIHVQSLVCSLEESIYYQHTHTHICIRT